MNLSDKISAKDLKVLKVGGTSVAILLFMTLIIFPLKDRISYYKNKTKAASRNIEELDLMSKRYGQLQKMQGKSGSGTNTDFNLFSFLEKSATETSIKKNIKSMKPSTTREDRYTETTVIVELENMNIEALVKYLYLIESSTHNLKIKRSEMKPRYSDPEKINATFVISYISASN